VTVDELIAELRKHPGDLQVYVSGYEAGVDDIASVEEVRVERNVHTERYYGPHETVGDEAEAEPGLQLLGGTTDLHREH